MKGNDDKPTQRSGKSDPKAKTVEKKGAPPPEQPAITIDKGETSKTYVSERAKLVDTDVQTSASDVGDYDLSPGVTSTPMQQDRKKIALVTPYHGGEAESSRLEDDETLIALWTLQVPGKAASNIRRTTKTAKGLAARLITSTSTKGSEERTKRTRGDSKALAKGKLLEVRVSRKPGKKVAPDSGTGRGWGAEGRHGSIVGTEVNKLNRLEAKAAKLAAAEADIANSNQSKNIDMQCYIDSQADKTGHDAPAVQDQGPPGDSSSSERKEDWGEKDKDSTIDSVSITTSQAKDYKKNNSFLTKDNVKLLSTFNKDGRMRELLINRIQFLTKEIPTTFRELKTDYWDQNKPDLEEAFYCLDDRERN
jgi:hypothetical protein